ncbi:IS4 family transposase [Lacticaseibacillus paracasei]|uniref:IS4 family transposase n=1 Tax=Lacticaseibacillus paracasei TaxID=1597 RepID=UPI000F0B6A37|nr:transposase [Lacticaseibacillus paracasei]RNE05157.1 transposase [Lacticaseibacillus paracasei]
MLPHNSIKNQLPTETYATFQELKILPALKSVGITKLKGFSTAVLFVFLFAMNFKGKAIFRQVTGREKAELMGKDTLYRFMNAPHYNWRRFLLKVSAFAIAKLHRLTSVTHHVRVLIVDDSSYYRNRSKQVNNLAWQFDHAKHTAYKGFRLLTLGFSDGTSFVPVDFALLSSKNQLAQDTLDKRTAGGRRAKEATTKSTDLVTEMVARALNQGIYATHVLMDKWYTKTKLVTQLNDLGIHVIGMVMNSKTKYLYQGQLVTLRALYKKSVIVDRSSAIISRVTAQLANGSPIQIVFVKNSRKQSQWLAILTTDIDLSAQEVVKTYRVRWDIETFFKAAKSLLKLAKETQARNYNALICHTTIVFIRYIILSWQQRCSNDERALGGLFYELCDELPELDWTHALAELCEILLDVCAQVNLRTRKLISKQLLNWYAILPSYIKACLPELVCES